jgi:hypothetical protein
MHGLMGTSTQHKRSSAHAENQLVPSLLRMLELARAGAAVIELGRSATDLLPHDSRTRRVVLLEH